MPDVWGTIVLGINILLLLAGWLLFQQAKSDLTARAAELPVLGEVKALQKSVASLLEQLKVESIQTSAQLDARCAEARDLLDAIDRRLEGARQAPVRTKRVKAFASPSRDTASEHAAAETETVAVIRGSDPRRERVYLLADSGATPAGIARETGLSEGEIELILGVRAQAS